MRLRLSARISSITCQAESVKSVGYIFGRINLQIYTGSFFYCTLPIFKQVLNLGSVSKQFTALSILLLREQGKLSLSDSLRKFFPELPYGGITVRHLLTHTSGLPDYIETMVAKWDHKKVAFNADMIGFLSREKPPILFKPGQRWEYSNTGYAMLASIVEKTSGQTFAQFTAQHIFKPLGMSRSRVYNTRYSAPEVISDFAYGVVYSDSLGKYVRPDQLPQSDMVYYLDGIQGQGRIHSTVGDLLKLAGILDRRKVYHQTGVLEDG